MAGEGEGTGEGTSEGTGEGAGGHWTAEYESLKGHPGLEKFETPGKMGESYLELETKIGTKGVLVPKEGASDDEMASFHSSLGRPDDSKAYFKDWKPPEGLPWDTNSQDTMAKVFHEVGLTATQAKKVIDSYAASQNELFREAQTTMSSGSEKAFLQLQSEYGEAFESNINLANRFGQMLMGEEGWNAFMGKQFVDGTTIGSNPEFVHAAVEFGKKLGEHKVFGMADVLPAVKTPDEVQKEIDTLKGDTGFMAALTDIENPEHKIAYDRWTALFQQLHPEQAA